MRSQSQDKRGPLADTPQGWGAFWWQQGCQGRDPGAVEDPALTEH
jgi:hypothetical protein